MIRREQILQPGSSLKHRLPWIDGGASSHELMPGGYEASDASCLSKTSSEHARSPLPRGSNHAFLTRDPSIRAIGSVPSLRRPSEKGIHQVSVANYPPAVSSLDLDSRTISRPSGFSDRGKISPTATRKHSEPPCIPPRHPDHHRRTKAEDKCPESLTHAVAGYETLMDDAVDVAEEASRLGRHEEVSQVLDEALQALRRASSVSQTHRANLNQPPRVFEFEPESGIESSSSIYTTDDNTVNDLENGTSKVKSRIGSLPNTVTVRKGHHRAITSEHGDIHSVAGTPPRFYNDPEDLQVMDFADRQPSQSSAVDGHKSRRESTRRPSRLTGRQGYSREPRNVLYHGDKSEQQDIHRLSIGEPSRALPEVPSNPWKPKHGLADEYYNEKPRRRHTSKAIGATTDDIGDVRRRKEHYRNLDPETPGLSLKRKHHFSLRSHQGFSFGHHVRRQPIARKWRTLRKRITATIACINTAFLGYVIGVYAGEVPKIQYQVVDPKHYIIQGNVYLFIGLAISTFFFWPLPLLHGRKPYTLIAFAIALPLQFPQAVVVSSVRPPSDASFRIGLLVSRGFTGLVLGLANINLITTLFDLFGASLQSSNPHQEVVFHDDVRRDGGGMGVWLGIWAWCFTGSISVGFLTGAGIISHLNPQWGFYITVIVGAVVLLLNVISPETRRSAYRRSYTEFIDDDEKVRRRIARGEAKLHLESEGPMWWGQEVWAGIRLNFQMLFQWGFSLLALYTGWTYAQVVLVIVVSKTCFQSMWRPVLTTIISFLDLYFRANIGCGRNMLDSESSPSP